MAEKSYDKMPSFRRGAGPQARFMPGAKPKNTKGTFLRLVKIYVNWKFSIIFAVTLTVLSTLISLRVPYLIGRAIDSFDILSGSIDLALLETILFSLVTFYLVSWLIETVNGILIARVSQKLVRHIRSGFFQKLQELPLQFFDTRSHGDTMSRLTNDVDNISQTVAQTTTQLVASVLSITGSLIMMLTLSPLLTLVAVSTTPLVFLLTKMIASRSRKYFSGQQREIGILSGIIEENVTGIKMVKAFNREEAVTIEFRRVNERLKAQSTNAQIWSGFLMPLMNVINNLSFTFIATAGGMLSIRTGLSIGIVVSFLTYSRQFGMPLNNIAGMFNTIQSALAGAERVFEIMDETSEPQDIPQAEELKNVSGNVEFKNVSFHYRAGVPVLSGISFRVPAGSTVALVGETGAGKTTIVNLLTRFYDTSDGDILIDKSNIKSVTRASLRECFSVVLQDTCLFTGTILDNIRYARPEATEAEVKRAAILARAHEFIARLPDGYHTKISGNTDNLSQGQRQLLSITRAILCDSPILILDEATSSVDTKTEKEIQRAMLTLMKNKTSFLIAHRLSTIRDADMIMLIANGKISEQGTHDELMNLCGKYYEMVQSQSGHTAI